MEPKVSKRNQTIKFEGETNKIQHKISIINTMVYLPVHLFFVWLHLLY